MGDMFLDNSGEISTKTITVSLPKFIEDSKKGIQYRRESQGQSENMTQFDKVGELDQSNGNNPSFFTWSELVDSAQDSPEVCQAVIVSDKFMFEHWPYALNLEDKLKMRL